MTATFDSNFFNTAAGQTIAGAHKYLSAAKELRHSPTWLERPKLLQTPVIHLLAHGVELLLKYTSLAQGASPEAVAKAYGHDLIKLWNAEANAFLRPLVLDRAVEAWEEAQSSGQWPGNDFSAEPKTALKGALDQLAFLHGRESGFALRYIVSPNTWAPRPAFLIDVFGFVAERSTMNPRLPLENW